jgi:hypothetical protein
MPRRKLPWLLLLTVPFCAGAQAPPSVTSNQSARDELLSLFQAENKRSTYIFYTQTYSLHGRRIEFHGSIFGAIQDVQVTGCDLKVKSGIFDYYSGNIGSKLVRQSQNKYITSIDFKLTPKMAEDLTVVDARPVRQLAEGTNAVCSGERQCNLTWLKLKAESPMIQMIDITDDVANYDGELKDFDGSVAQVYLPISSRQSGDEIIAKMRTFAQLCAQ